MRPLNKLGKSLALIWLIAFFSIGQATVQAQGSSQNPQSGSIGFQATISGPPPSQAASISVPANDQVFTTSPITVSGLCPNNLLIRLFDNNIFVGSTVCSGGSYSLQISLFSGTNDLEAIDYDALDQAGPSSNQVSVTYRPVSFIAFGNQLFLTTNYAEKGVNPGQELDWPITINGGSPPYALSTDWGDGQTATLQSAATAGQLIIKHVYSSSGTYEITVRATDSTGQTTFLQLVGVVNGQVLATSNVTPKSNQPTTKTNVIWWPAILTLPFTIAAFWLGRRHQNVVTAREYS